MEDTQLPIRVEELIKSGEYVDLGDGDIIKKDVLKNLISKFIINGNILVKDIRNINSGYSFEIGGCVIKSENGIIKELKVKEVSLVSKK